MGSRLSRLLSVDHPDPATRTRGRNALVIFYGVIAVGIPSSLGLLFIPHGAVLGVITFAFLALAVICTRIVSSGRVTLGVGLFFVLLISAEVAFPIMSGDSRLTAIYLVVPVAIAGVTLDRPWLAAVTATSLTLAVIVTLAYPPEDPPISTFEIILATLIVSGFVVVALLLGLDGLRREATRADESAARAEALSVGLAATNEDLEERVASRTAQLELALTRQEALVAELAELSLRDPLTGLHNRRHADHELPRLLAAADRYEHPLALAMADLDHFKRVNDDHNYAIGDEVLRRFAEILRRTTRTTDVITRYGGEEFLVMMPQTGLDAARVLCERLRLDVEQHPWHEVAPGLIVTVSIGLADTHQGDGLINLVASADAALHRAKREGRNQVVSLTGDARREGGQRAPRAGLEPVATQD